MLEKSITFCTAEPLPHISVCGDDDTAVLKSVNHSELDFLLMMIIHRERESEEALTRSESIVVPSNNGGCHQTAIDLERDIYVSFACYACCATTAVGLLRYLNWIPHASARIRT